MPCLAKELREKGYEVLVDEREMRGGEKSWSWVKKGVPLRLEIGPRDIAENKVVLMRRDKPHKEKNFLSREELLSSFGGILEQIQQGLYQKALSFREKHSKYIDSKEDFYAFFTPKNRNHPEIHGGFAYTHWCGEKEVEEQIKKELGVTIRCIPDHIEKEPGICPFSGKPSSQRVIFAKSY